VLYRGWRRRARSGGDGSSRDWPILAALLAAAAMAGHSIGDFNLQIPATTWVLAALVGLALARVADNDESSSRLRRRSAGIPDEQDGAP
jgi:hypothetical protein